MFRFRSGFSLVLLLGLATVCFAQDGAAPSTSSVQQLPTVQENMENGIRAIHQNESAKAEQFFKEALAVSPDLPEAYLGLGMAALREGKPENAEEALAHAIKLNENLPGAHMFLGIAQDQANELPAAVESLQAEIKLQPQNVEALTWLGIVELAAGHPELATNPLDQAAALSPKNPEILDYRGRAHTQVAQQNFQQLYALDPNSWHVHRALAETLSEAHEPEQAVTEYKAAIDGQPKNPDLYEALGNEYQRLSRTPDAIEAYQSELKLNPRSAIALFELGKLKVESAHPADGIPLLRQALEAHVPQAPAYYYLGMALSDTADNKGAAEALETCLANKPVGQMEMNAWYALARVYTKLNRTSDAQHALEEFKRMKAAAAPPQPGTSANK